MDISIIIVSFNTEALLRDCIRSIYETVGRNSFEIIVVDNASSDGTLQMLADQFPAVRVISNGANLGFAKANNQAIGISSGRMVLLLNSDTVVKAGAIESLFRFMQEDPSVAAAGPKVLNIDGTVQSMGASLPSLKTALISFLRIPHLFPLRLRKRFFPEFFDRDPDRTDRVGWVNGCCMMISRKALSEIGPLDEDFYFYCEEVEWCFRAARAGYRINYCPQAEIFHYGGASKIDQPSDRLAGAIVLLYRKCFGKARGTVILTLTVLSGLSSLAFAYTRTRGNEAEIVHLKKNLTKNVFLMSKLLRSRDAA